jgi:hypothetical protein
MRVLKATKLLTLITLELVVFSSVIRVMPSTDSQPVMVSYNPGPAGIFHAPLSSIGVLAVTNATPDVKGLGGSQSHDASNLRTIRQNALRFINDTSYFPQSETTIAVDPNNPNHVVGGFNDDKYFFCPLLPADCGTSAPASESGFTTSTDGGKTVAKSNDIPGVNVSMTNLSTTNTVLIPWGDPSVAATVDGNFFYASLALSPFGSVIGNGILIAKSNLNLFNSTISCNTPLSDPIFNACWKSILVFANTAVPVFEFNDKDRIAVDRDPSSPYFGSVYVAWDHFFSNGASQSFLARCDPDLVSCTTLYSYNAPFLSGNDQFVAWTTPVVDKDGNIHVAWCNFGTSTTYGPVECKMTSSPPGGKNFGSASNILSYMGTGTTLPADTVVLGWATEQFRTSPGLISIAADPSAKSNNLYFTTSLCVSGHYYAFSGFAGIAADNPGDCGESAIVFVRSTDGGQSWSDPVTLSKLVVNDQPSVTVDSQTGTVYVVCYTTQYDPFDHRIDVVSSTSYNLGMTFHQQRITSVSGEPNSDPNMYDYLVGSGFGGSFSAPQYGDYFEATARGGVLWVLFTANYAVEAGTFQTDPFLAVTGQDS